MGTKATPKSCSCPQCKCSKHTKGGKAIVKREERSFRHKANAALKKGDFEGILSAGRRSRIG